MSKKTRPCGACCNLGEPIPENEHHRAGGFRIGHCWAGPQPWRSTRELVHGCKARDVPHKRWTPEKQWHWPDDHHKGDDHEPDPSQARRPAGGGVG